MESTSDRRRIYNQTYYCRHRDRFVEKFWCATCNGFFTLPNRSNHFKTTKHHDAMVDEGEWEAERERMEEIERFYYMENTRATFYL